MSSNVNDIGLDNSPRPAGRDERRKRLQPTLSNLDDSQGVSKSQARSQNVRDSNLSVPSQAKKRRNSNASSDNSRDSRVSRRTGRNAVKENPREALENQVKNNKYVNFANEEQFDAGNVASVQRSFMLTNNDRHQLELQHMKPLQSGGGFGGNSQNYDVVGLMAKKIEYFNIKVRGDADKKLPQGQILIQKTEQDGIFIDAPLEFKNKDVNVQKLEERILNTYNANKGPVELCRAEIYFEPNGEIKLKNDLLAAELTRPADLAFEQTDAFQTVEHNAIMTDRLNSFKKRYYRIDIIVGKLILKKSDLFSQEDQMVMDLKNMCKLYDRRVQQALIPFYIERIDYLNDEIDKAEFPKDISFLEKLRDELKSEQALEEKAIKDQANGIYKLWRDVCDLRKEGNPQTSAKLSVHKGTPKGLDVLFNINEEQRQGQMSDEVAKRKDKTEKTMVQAKLLIDDQVVAISKKTPLSWPSYEADLLEQFQIYVFTLPHQVQLEIYFNERVVDIIDVQIPGKHVNTLTSASKLINEHFFKNQHQKDIEEYELDWPVPTQDVKVNPSDEAFQKELKDFEKNSDRLAAEKRLKKNQAIDGSVFIKAEWEGSGGEMPPAASKTIFSMGKLHKNRHEFDKKAVVSKLLDVNDPRNVDIMNSVQMMKNDYLETLLKNDSKFQLFELDGQRDAFRHKLLKARMNDPPKSLMTVPQLCSEIVQDGRTKYYIDWLEQVYRDQAARIQAQNDDQNKVGNERGLKALDNAFDQDTKNRRMEIKLLVDQRKKEGTQGHANRNKQMQYTSVIDEPQFEADQDWLGIIKGYFTFARKLKPKIKKKAPKEISSQAQIKLVFNILRGTNVPIRIKYYNDAVDLNDDVYQEKDANRGRIMDENVEGQIEEFYGKEQSQTLVEVRIVNPDPQARKQDQEVVLETKIADGQYPEWNENLQYTLKSKSGGGFAPGELEQSPIMIYFTLFDQFQATERLTAVKTVTIREKRYLGSFSVPLTTILADNKFEGQIRLNRPLVLQDYRVLNDDIFNKASKGAYKDNLENSDESISTYLSLSISVQPFIQIPRDNEKDYYQGKEEGDLLTSGTKWARNLQDRYKRRNQIRSFKVFLLNLDNKSIFIPRLLTPLMPPLELSKQKTTWSDDEYAIEKVARFVSLIPFAEDSSMFEGLPDMTCTAQQFLDLGAGDSEEHAMLLCNFFNYIDRELRNKKNKDERFGDIESYICFGDAVPNGEGWFVMRRNKSKVKENRKQKNDMGETVEIGNIINYTEIWDASTGECFVFGADNNDPICPLKKLWCVVGMENVWANKQGTDIPQMMSYDLENKNNWEPFLDVQRKAQFFGTQDPKEEDRRVWLKSRLLARNQINKEKKRRAANPNLIPSLIYQADQIIYSKNQDVTLDSLEKQIKKYLCGKFEDERIAAVKKTTNWYRNADKMLRQVFKQDPKKFTTDFLEKQQKQAKKSKKKGKSQGIDDMKDISQGAMDDMETYMMIARQGGTASDLRGKFKDSEQEIKMTSVQYMLKGIGDKENKKIWAIPVNTTFSRLDEIWEKLKQTRMHEIDNSEAQFSLEVMLKKYPCNVYSVWMYIAVFRNNDEY